MSGTSVMEIHSYPLRPPGFEEPLFPTPGSRRRVVEHLLEAPWLARASELRGRAGEAAHALEEPVRLKVLCGRVEVVRRFAGRCSWRRRSVVEVLDRWREVAGWWDVEAHVDRVVFRVLLSGGVVADLARRRSGGWFLVGVFD